MSKKIILFVVAMLLGIVIIRQINARQSIATIMDPNKTYIISQEVAELIKGNQKLRSEYSTLEQQNIDLQKTTTNTSEADQSLEKELIKLKIISGINDVTGSGIEISLGENLEQTQMVDLVNALRNIGAEAITIGDKRIVVNTSITPDLANNNNMVYVIGNQDILYDSLLRRGGIIEQIGSNASIAKKEVTIPANK